MLLIVFSVLALGATAFAALGEHESSVQTDQQKMKLATRSTTASAKFTVHEMRTDNGPVVREFATPGGIIFGVAWQTPTMPDLRQMLGNYYDQFEKARLAEKSSAIRRRGPLYIKTPGLVVEGGGHMRAYIGRAYDPTLVPDGVSPDDIK